MTDIVSSNDLLDRQQAANFLGISTRTLDRHVAKNKYSLVRKEGKVYFHRKELEHSKQIQNPHIAQVISYHGEEQSPVGDNTKYKILYEESLNTIEKKDGMIQKMHYQLGILETQIKNSIPMLESENMKSDLEHEIVTLEEIKIQKENEIAQLQKGKSFYVWMATFFFLVSICLGVFLFS